MYSTGVVVGVFSLVLLASYYYFFVAQKPKVYVKNKQMRKFLQDHMTILNETYWPAIFYWEGRLQTYFGLTKRITTPHRLLFKRELLPLSDGGELALDTMEPNQPLPLNQQRVVVLLLPGVSSSSRTSYMRTLVRAIQNVGATTVVFNNRGFGGLRLKTPRTHSARNVEDLREVVTHLKNVYPDDKIIALGTSLGGVVLCHYLIDHPEESAQVFTAALLLSIVWDFYAAMLNLEKPYFNKYIINSGLTKDLVYRVLREKEMFQQRKYCWDFEKIGNCKTGRDFDTLFHVPQWGYKSVEEYWSHCCLLGKTHKFNIPVFALNSYDDPMMPGEGLPVSEAMEDYSNLALVVTCRGGHLGFLEGISTKPKETHYMERFTAQFIQAIVSDSKALI